MQNRQNISVGKMIEKSRRQIHGLLAAHVAHPRHSATDTGTDL